MWVPLGIISNKNACRFYVHPQGVCISEFKPMGHFHVFSAPSIPNQNPRGQRQNNKDLWAGSDSSRNAPDETQKSRHHTKLCVNNGYLAKESQFWIDFTIRADTHEKIRKCASKVTCFHIPSKFPCQNAQGSCHQQAHSRQNARGIRKTSLPLSQHLAGHLIGQSR